jgi:succinoglycan biosynthesis protein ExoM
MPNKDFISVCICTYLRPHFFQELLKALDGQETGDAFEYEIVVVDNDKAESARLAVEFENCRTKKAIRYFVEPDQNIARARNKAVANAKGNLVAFIDDDELPGLQWLIRLYRALTLFETPGVLGPVLPKYASPPPQWVVEGRFFDRPRYFTGHFLYWEMTRTGNCLLRKAIFEKDGKWFDHRFGSGGEDRDFFKRMIARGHVFVWCDEAPLHEWVPAERWKKHVMLKRALLRGKMTYESRKRRPLDPLVSLVTVFIYSLALPYLLVVSPFVGFEVFMKYLINSFDHLGKLFAVLGINLIKKRYIT